MRTGGALVGLVVAAALGPNGGCERLTQAAPAATGFYVEIAPTNACAESDAFSSELLARTQRLQPTTVREGALLFRLEFFSDEGGFLGRLHVLEPGENETVREVRGTTCEEVVSGLALIAAVLIDPNASTGAIVKPSPSKVEQKPPEYDEAARRRASTPPASRAPRSNTSSRSRWRFGGGTGAIVESGVAPEPSPGLWVSVNATLETVDAWSPLFGLTLNRTLTQSVPVSGGTAELRWTALRVEGCPLAFSPNDWSRFRPCGLFDLGVLQGRGVDTERPSDVSPVWLAFGASGRVELLPLPAWGVLLDAALILPVVHQRFYFDPESPESVAFDVPAVGIAGRLGVVSWFR